MKNKISLIFLSISSLFAFPCAAQTDPAAAVCLAILKQNLYDSNDVYSAQYHFAQYQNILKTANFSSYAEYASKGAGLGLDIPLADGLIGFSGDYKSDNSTFQQQINTFLSSQYNESVDQAIFSQHSVTIDQQLVNVADHCQQNYYDSYKDRIHLSIRVEPNSYASFTVKLVGYIPPPFNVTQKLQVTQIEPSPDVKCKQGGADVSLPIVSDNSNIVLLTCTKDAGKNVQFAIATNLGLSDPINLPPTPPPPPPQTQASKHLHAIWTADHPMANMIPFMGCGCVSVRNDLTAKKVTIVNNCSKPVPAIYVKDTEDKGPLTPVTVKRDGRSFAYFILETDQDVVLDMNGAVGGYASFLACPDVPTPPAALVCRMEAPGGVFVPSVNVPFAPLFAAPPPPYGPSWRVDYGYCFAAAGAKKGDACSCPKAPPQPGTVAGHVDQ